MAAKRIRPSDGQQDFGFLKADESPESGEVQGTPSFPDVPNAVDPPTAFFSDAGSSEASETAVQESSEIEQPTAESASTPPPDHAPHAAETSPTDSVSVAAIAPAPVHVSAPVPGTVPAPVPDSPPDTAVACATAAAPVTASAHAAVAAPVPVQCVDLKGSDPLLTTAGMKGSDPFKSSAPVAASKSDSEPHSSLSSDHVNRTLFVGVVGYAIALTLLLLALLLTGRLSLFGNPTLESLPDLRPLAPNEFRKVPDNVDLPDGHVLRIGESRRFGDVVVTPVRVTKDPLRFQTYNSGVSEAKLTTKPVLHLWLTFENVGDYPFPPFDAGLMSNRTPPDSSDEATIANSFLRVSVPSGDKPSTRVLNFLQKIDNYFVITGQESGKILSPEQSLTTFVASSEDVADLRTDDSTSFVWRVQFRKGVHTSSGNGVTTLIDVKFSGADLATAG